MDLTKEISEWLTKIQFTFFNFKNGFFHLKLQTKSPQKMIESFDKIPFLKHDKIKKSITTNNPLMRININYLEIQSGLWVMYSESEYKSNVFYTTSSDLEDKKDAYYFINLHTNNSKLAVQKMLLNGSPLQNNTWNIVKPLTVRQLTHFKNIQEKNITIYFNDTYLNSENSFFKKNSNPELDLFFNSSNSFLCAQEKEDKAYHFEKVKRALSKNEEDKKREKISKIVIDLFQSFSDCISTQKLTENYYRLNEPDRKNIIQVEELLNENLTNNFPGIDCIADKVGVSSTKLKNDFKTVHDTSIFQFYRNNQLEMAYGILQNQSLKIKHLALLFGYENTSKFSTAFKNRFGVNPSDIQ